MTTESAPIIRPVKEDDLEALGLLYQDLVPEDPKVHPEEAASILEQIKRYPGSNIFVVEVAGSLAASCTLLVVPNLSRGGRPYAFIENVVTSKHHRRRGFGKMVLRHAIDIAWEHDCYRVALLTGSKHPGTHAFYKDVGFDQQKTAYQIRRVPPRRDTT